MICPQAAFRFLLSVLRLRDTLIALLEKILRICAPIKKTSNLDEKQTYSNHTLYTKPHNEEKRDEGKKWKTQLLVLSGRAGNSNLVRFLLPSNGNEFGLSSECHFSYHPLS